MSLPRQYGVHAAAPKIPAEIWEAPRIASQISMKDGRDQLVAEDDHDQYESNDSNATISFDVILLNDDTILPQNTHELAHDVASIYHSQKSAKRTQ
jgi:hypothetical protein